MVILVIQITEFCYKLAPTNHREWSVSCPHLTTAFDTSDHFLLLDTHSSLGSQDTSRLWFSSFLFGYAFPVSFADPSSSPRPLNVGWPGFSPLSSLFSLFYVYIHYRWGSHPVFNFKSLLYVSDFQIFISALTHLSNLIHISSCSRLISLCLISISKSTCSKPLFFLNLLHSKPSPSQLMTTLFF